MGFSLKDLSQESGLSHSYLNEIEKGKKYPKLEKLQKLADALGVAVDELVSAKMGRQLHPLLSFLESDLATSLPLSAFGIGEQDVYDLMSHSPEKFTSFLMTVSELAKSFDVSVDDLNKAALRAYLEVNNNHFPYLEELGSTMGRQLRNDITELNPLQTYQYFKKKLEGDFGIKVDDEKIGQKEGSDGLISLFKRADKGGILYLNPSLDIRQKIFALVKELGAQHLISDDSLKNRDPLKTHFSDLLLEYQTEYFAGALLVPENELIADLKRFFSLNAFDQELFSKVFDKYLAPPEFIIERLTQVLPHHFGLNQLFFLRCNEEVLESPGRYYIDQELHLGQLHHPHGVSLREHYCRRWVTIELLAGLEESSQLIGTQVSQMGEKGSPYFLLSFAHHNTLYQGKRTCYTLGLAINESLNSVVGEDFYEGIEKKIVGRTCERCTIADCDERVSPPSISIRANKDRLQRDLIRSLLD